jgi:hypothetical protein
VYQKALSHTRDETARKRIEMKIKALEGEGDPAGP